MVMFCCYIGDAVSSPIKWVLHVWAGSAISNGREPKNSCLGQVFNSKLGHIATALCSKCMVCVQPLLKLKTWPEGSSCQLKFVHGLDAFLSIQLTALLDWWGCEECFSLLIVNAGSTNRSGMPSTVDLLILAACFLNYFQYKKAAD
jgi:hypothetical protein